MKRIMFPTVSVFVAVVLACLCLMDRAAAEEPVVKIGLNYELSGKQSSYGLAATRAMRYEVAKKNAAGGIKAFNGAKIELVELDNATSAAAATSNAERFGSDPNILMTMGPCTSALSNAIEPTIGKWKTPSVFTLTTADTIFQRGNKYIVSVTVMASKVGSTYARFMVFMHEKYKLSLERITLAYPDDDYGKDLAKGFIEELTKSGLAKNIVADLPFDWQAKDFTPLVLKIKNARPDFHLQVARTADGKLYHDACFTQRFHPYQVGGTSGFNHPDQWKLLGDEIGAVTLGNPKTFFMELGAFDVPNPVRDEWVKRFNAQYPDIPIEQNLYYGATTALLVLDALEQAKSRSREAINDALHNFQYKQNDVRDFTGAFESPGPAFEPDGRARSWPVIGEWRKVNGEWQKASLWHPTGGVLKTPKAFIK